MSPKLVAGSPALLRQHNSALILRAIRVGGSLSRPELAKATGLSQPTVNEIARVLVKSGYVRERPLKPGDRPARRGPRAPLLSFNASVGYVLGIDIAAGRIIILASDLAGRIIAEDRTIISRREMLRPDPLLALIRARITAALRSAGIARSKLMAVGIGTPGIIDPRSGSMSLAPALPEWEGMKPAERLAGSFSCPILVNSDVHLAVLAERGFGAAVGIDDAIYLHLGVGIGLGILIGGKLYRGADGAAGEIGYLLIGRSKQKPETGFGRFEWTSGSTAFARLGQQAVGPAGKAGLIRELAGANPDLIGPEVVFEAARRGDTAAQGILDQLIDQLAEGIAAVVCVLNPATVILGAEIAQGGPQLIEPLSRRIAQLVPRPPRRFVASSLGEEAVALGAVQTALQAVNDGLLTPSAFVGAPSRQATG
jgi:predicted NBD/HSP70 family sugar kinase